MTLWRPRTRTAWWVAFTASSILVPVLIALTSLIAGQLMGNVLVFYIVSLLLAPIAGCYLLVVTRLPFLAKVILIPVFFVTFVYMYAPRSRCGDESISVPTPMNGKADTSANLNCNA